MENLLQTAIIVTPFAKVYAWQPCELLGANSIVVTGNRTD